MALPIISTDQWTNTEEIGSRQLSWPVASLAKHVLEAVPILHSFQTALVHAYGLSSTRVEYFKVQKILLRQEWEHWVALLEQCFTYSRHLLQYSHNSASTTPTPSTSPARALLDDATMLRHGSSRILATYKTFFDAFERSWAVKTASKVDQLHQDTTRFISLAHSSVNTPLSESLIILGAAIGDLEQISNFWSEHYVALGDLRLETPSLRQPSPAEMTVWRMYHDATRQSISTITASCDAISVIRSSPLTWSIMRTIWNRFRRRTVLVMINGPNGSPFYAMTPEASQTTEEGFKVLTSTNHFHVRSLISASRKAQKVLASLKATESNGAKVEGGDDEASLMTDVADHCRSFYASAANLVGEERLEVIVQLIQKMSEDATAVVRLHQQVMEEHKTRLSQLRKLRNAGAEGQQPHTNFTLRRKVTTFLIQSRPRQHAETTLEHLEQTLESFDSFWFNMLAATAFLQTREKIHIIDARKACKSWKKQEESYRKYLDEAKNGANQRRPQRTRSSRSEVSNISSGSGDKR